LLGNCQFLGSAGTDKGYVRSKETRQEVADNTTNGVLSEHIEAFVNADQELDLGAEVASDRANNAEDDSGPRRNETGTRGDGDETSNDTGTETHGAPLPLKTVIEENPSQATDAGSNVGNNAGHDGAGVGSKSGTTVEAEPANPEEDGSKNDVGDIVGAVRQAADLAVAGTLSEHQGIRESSGA
jgi:hypothetical protein